MKVRRKIVALSTAFVMVFALVAAMVPATVTKAESSEKYIYPDGTISERGDLGDYIANIPGSSEYSSIKVDATSKTVTFDSITITGGEYSGISFYSPDGWTLIFTGTNSMAEIMDGQNLTVSVGDNSVLSLSYFRGDYSLAEGTKADKDISNASFDDPVENVKLTGPTSGGGDQGGGDQGGDADQGGSADQTPATTEVKTLQNGESATLNPSTDGTVSFRIEKDFEYFQNGGKLYVDGQEVPSDQYSATPGSTIITFVKEYAAKLADGFDHAVKVVFGDGEEFNATIKVAAASSDGTAANGTSGTASSTAATTTKVTSPKTADVLPIAGIALVFVGATAIGVIAIRRKNS